MANSQLRIQRTNKDALIGNLRGEVGEAITSWILLRHLIFTSRSMQTDDVMSDMRNNDLGLIHSIKDKIESDFILTLAALAERKVARVTFHFASQKLHILRPEEEEYRNFIEQAKLKQKRDREIAHREQPEDWPEVGDIRIPYLKLLQALAMAVRLMKKIVKEEMGDNAIVQWQRMRKKRYDLTMPARAKYLLLGYLGKES